MAPHKSESRKSAEKAAQRLKAGTRKTEVPAIAPAESESAEPPDRWRLPHHLQDKQGYCGAACIMMLLDYDGIKPRSPNPGKWPLNGRNGDCCKGWELESQSNLMREIKRIREEFQKQDGESTKHPPAETHYAWHASPREIEKLLNKRFSEDKQYGDGMWKLNPASQTESGGSSGDLKGAMDFINESLVHGPGVIALIWWPTLKTRHPHWVLIEKAESNGYWILDPAATGRPSRTLRYESISHQTREGGDFCPCLTWRDGQGRHGTADRIWVPTDKMEELLDEGAARAGGLRYVITRTKPARKPDDHPQPTPREHLEEKMERRRIRRIADLWIEKVEASKLGKKLLEWECGKPLNAPPETPEET